MAVVVTPPNNAINCPCVNADWAASTPPGTYPPGVWGSLGPDGGGGGGGGDMWTWTYGDETTPGHLSLGEGEVMVNPVDLSGTDQLEFLTDQANVGRVMHIVGPNGSIDVTPIDTISDNGAYVVIIGLTTTTGTIDPADILTVSFADA